MKAKDIRVGSVYAAKVSGNIVPVRVDVIREVFTFDKSKTAYDVKNLKTGRVTTFRSAAKFRYKLNDDGSPIMRNPTADAIREMDAWERARAMGLQ